MGRDQVGDLAVVLGEVFHLSAVYCVVQGDVALIVPDYDPLLQEVEVECTDLIRCHVHVDFLYVAIQCAPHFDFVTRRGEE